MKKYSLTLAVKDSWKSLWEKTSLSLFVVTALWYVFYMASGSVDLASGSLFVQIIVSIVFFIIQMFFSLLIIRTALAVAQKEKLTFKKDVKSIFNFKILKRFVVGGGGVLLCLILPYILIFFSIPAVGQAKMLAVQGAAGILGLISIVYITVLFYFLPFFIVDQKKKFKTRHILKIAAKATKDHKLTLFLSLVFILIFNLLAYIVPLELGYLISLPFSYLIMANFYKNLTK